MSSPASPQALSSDPHNPFLAYYRLPYPTSSLPAPTPGSLRPLRVLRPSSVSPRTLGFPTTRVSPSLTLSNSLRLSMPFYFSSPNSLEGHQDAPQFPFCDPSNLFSEVPQSHLWVHQTPLRPLSLPLGLPTPLAAPPNSFQTPIPPSSSQNLPNAITHPQCSVWCLRAALGLTPRLRFSPPGTTSGPAPQSPSTQHLTAGPTCAPSWFSCCMSPPTASGTGSCMQCRRPMASSWLRGPCSSHCLPKLPPQPLSASPRFRSRTFATGRPRPPPPRRSSPGRPERGAGRPRGAADARGLWGVGAGSPRRHTGVPLPAHGGPRPQGGASWRSRGHMRPLRPVEVPGEPSKLRIPYRFSR